MASWCPDQVASSRQRLEGLRPELHLAVQHCRVVAVASLLPGAMIYIIVIIAPGYYLLLLLATDRGSHAWPPARPTQASQ
jgi:hypothetical protein